MMKRILLGVLSCISLGSLAAQVNLDVGRLAYLPLNGNGQDLSGNGNHATVSAVGVYPGSDRRNMSGQAMYFNGSLEQGALSFGSPLLNNRTEFSMSFWFRPESNAATMSLVGQDNILETGFYVSPLRLIVFHPTSTNTTINLSQGAGVWQHVAVTCNATEMRVYLNGLLVSTRLGNHSLGNNTTNTQIGGNVVNTANNTWHRGELDEVMFYNRVLTVDEVAVLSSSQSLTLSVGSLAQTQYCAGQSINVPFTVLGTLQPSNTFHLQLSDANGSFDRPYTLGSLVGVTSGSINATLPANLPSGDGYRLRIVSSLPMSEGAVSSQSLSIRNSAESWATLSRDRLVWYKFDGNAADSSGNAFDGTLVGGTSFVTDRFGNPTGALQLNGVNGHVVLPEAACRFRYPEFTISAWVNPSTFVSWSRIIDFSNGPNSDNVVFALSNSTSGNPHGSIRRGSTEQALAGRGGGLGQWTHLSMRYDGSILSLYRNGILVSSAAVHSPRYINRIITYLGRSAWSADAFAHAAYDDFMLHERALTEDEIRALASDGLIQYNRTPCVGGVLELSAPLFAGATYQWTGPNGFSANQRQAVISNLTAANSGTYQLNISGVGVCAAQSYSTSISLISPATQPAVSFSGLPLTTNVLSAANTLTGAPVGGDFSGPGLQNLNQFSPLLAGEGLHSINYQVMGAGGCLTAASQNVLVLPSYTMNGTTVNTCTGGFYDDGGAANYSPNANLSQTLCSDNGERLRLDFLHSVTQFAAGDTLWVYDGPSTSSPLLGAYWQGSRIERLTASGTCLSFAFRSNASTARGWQADISCVSNNFAQDTFNMTSGIRVTCDAIVRDPGGTGNYGYGEWAQTYKSYNGERLRFTRQGSFGINGNHFVRFHDGPDASYPVIGTYNNGSPLPSVIESTGEYLYIAFSAVSTGWSTQAGFEGRLTCFGSILPVYNMANTLTTACEGVFYDNAGANANYSPNQNLVHTFCSDNGQLMQIEFNNVTTSFAAGDTLFVYDGNSVSAPLLGLYIQGSTLERLTASGTCLSFRFVSDNANNARGWQGYLSCLPVRPVQDTFNMSSGLRVTCDAIVRDPGGTGNYGYGEWAQTYKSYNGERLRFTRQGSFGINGNHFVRFHDGPDASYPVIGTYNNGSPLPSVIESTGEYLYIAFSAVSTGWSTQAGFEGRLTCFGSILPVYNMANTLTTACEGVFYDNAGANANYSPNQNLVHTFCSDNGQLMQIAFNNVTTSFAAGDTLFAYDGNSVSAPLLGLYIQGSTLERLTASGTCLSFRFVSDNANNARGWQGYLSCLPVRPVQDTFNMSSGLRVTCDAIVRDPGGTGNYGYGEWAQTYKSYNGERLRFTRQGSFGINGNHFVRFHDGPDASYPVIGTYNNGSPLPSVIESTGEYLYIAFSAVSTGWSTQAGFEGRLTCITPALPIFNMANTLTTACEGVFYDDGGANGNYAHNQNLVHTFCSANGQLMEFLFNNVTTALVSGDTLWAFDGADVNAPLLGIYIQGSIIEPLRSSSTCLTFRFRSDNTNNARGWQAQFNCINNSTAANTFSMSSGLRAVCAGTFLDNGGNGNYSHGTWVQTFRSYSGERLRATRNTFDIANGHFFDVFDGEDVTAPLIGTYNNTTPPPTAFQSTGTSLTFRLRATNTSWTTRAGWSYSLSCFTGEPIDAGVVQSPICQNSTFQVPFTLNATVNAGNTYTVQLSNASGSFASPVTIGSLVSSASSGLITATMPNGTAVGTGYRVRVVSSDPVQIGSPNPNPLSVTATPQQPASITRVGPANFCNSTGTATLSIPNQPGMNYRWFRNDTIPVGTNSPEHIATEIGVYRVEISSSCDTILSIASVTIGTIVSPIVYPITAAGSTSFCTGGSVALSVPLQTGVNYQWRRDGSNVGSNSPNFTATQAGVYSLQMSNSCGTATASNTVTVTILGAGPTATAISSSQGSSICNGANTTLSVTPQANVNYQWFRDGSPVGGNSPDFTASQAGLYTLQFQNACGTISATNSINLSVVNPPNVASISAGGSTSFCSGGSVLLSVSSQAGVNYQWRRSGVNVGTNSASYTATQAGVYDLVLSNVCGTVTSSNNITVTITGSAPLANNITAAGSTSFCAGNSVSLSTAVQALDVNYQWRRNGLSVGTNSPGYVADQAGVYDVVFSNSCGNIQSSNSITVTITGTAPTATTISANGPRDFCAGGSVGLSIPPQSGVSYQWLRNGFTLSGATGTSYTVSTTGFYEVLLSNSCGTFTATGVQVNVVAASPNTPGLSASGSTTICQGNQVTLSTSSQANAAYQWLRNGSNVGTNSTSFAADQTGSYQVRVTNACGSSLSSAVDVLVVQPATAPSISAGGPTSFCSGGSVTLNTPSQANVSYQWLRNGNPVGFSANSHVASLGGVYTLNLSNACGTVNSLNSISVTITGSAPNTPSLNASGSTDLCAGGQVTFSVTAQGGVNYQWFVNNSPISGANSNSYQANAAGSYRIELSNSCGTVSSNTLAVTLTANPPTAPVLSAGGSTDLCAGTSVVLSTTAQAAVSYQWRRDGNAVGSNSASYTASVAGVYTLQLSNACGQVTSSNSITVTPNGALPNVPTITANGPLIFCANGGVALAVPNQAWVDYQWLENGQPVGNNTPSHTVTTAATFTLRLTNHCGQVMAANSLTTGVNPLPPAPTITADGPLSFCSGARQLSGPLGMALYEWSDGQTGQTILQNTDADLSLRITDANGCISPWSDTLEIRLVNTPVFQTLNQSLCQGDSLFFAGAFRHSAGIYRDTLLSQSGCDSILVLDLALDSLPQPTIQQNGALLSTQAGMLSYQWLLNGQAIPNATQAEFLPTQNGFYRVQVRNQAGCTGLSDSLQVLLSALEGLENQAAWRVFPNPSEEVFFLESSEPGQNLSFQLFDLQGRLLQAGEFLGQSRLSLRDYPAAVYMLRLHTPTQSQTFRLIKTRD